MAKVEGTQSIASALLKKYQAALTSKTSTSHVRIRMPFTLPKSKAGGRDESTARATQRARFKTAQSDFADLDTDGRSDWYNSAPVWNSYLWYYNWFILASLNGVSGVPGHADVVIKSINHYTFTLPTGAPANVTVSISSIDPNKGMAFFYGAAPYEIVEGAIMADFPYLVELGSTYALVKASLYAAASAGCGLTIIEYI